MVRLEKKYRPAMMMPKDERADTDDSQILNQLQIALQHISQGLCMYDAAGRLVLFNDRFRELYNLPSSIGPGSSFREVMQAQHLFRPEEAATYSDTVEREASNDAPLEFIASSASGALIKVVRQRTANGGWVATHENIAQHRHDQLELSRTKSFLTTVIGIVPAGIVVKDVENRRYVLVNKMAEVLFGQAAADCVGKTIEELVPPQQAHLVSTDDQRLIDSGEETLATHSIVHTKSSGVRHVSTKRVLIRDLVGTPKYLAAVIEDITEQKRAEAHLVHLAHHDPLTDLANRALLIERLEEALGRQDGAEPIGAAVLMLDLDMFKHVNDSLGHAAGDQLLRMTAQRIGSCLSGQEIAARVGGDEFAILQLNGTVETAEVLAQHVLVCLSEPFELSDRPVSVSASVGIAIAPEHGGDPDLILHRADLALYDAKSRGRNSYVVFAPSLETKARSREVYQLEIKDAVDRGEFELHYQPILDAVTGKTVCLEALVRWRHPTRGLILPGEFIPLAEENGVIGPLGKWIMAAALKQAGGWPNDIKVAVNLSPVQLESDLVETIVEMSSRWGVLPSRLELEVTETVLIDRIPHGLDTLNRLHQLGISIVLDDFGTGYSSLSYLRSFPFSKIKIDRSFVGEITTSRHSAAIIAATTGLARSLGLRTTAEGVETREQLLLLQAAGVNEIQGYLISHPVSDTLIVARRFCWEPEFFGMSRLEVLENRVAHRSR